MNQLTRELNTEIQNGGTVKDVKVILWKYCSTCLEDDSNKSERCLRLAATLGLTSTVKILLEAHKEDPVSVDAIGQTALITAITSYKQGTCLLRDLQQGALRATPYRVRRGITLQPWSDHEDFIHSHYSKELSSACDLENVRQRVRRSDKCLNDNSQADATYCTDSKISCTSSEATLSSILKVVIDNDLHEINEIPLHSFDGTTITEYEACIEILLNHVAYLRLTDQAGNTPLILAADAGLLSVVHRILSRRQQYNINWSNCYSETALHRAAENNHFDVMELLVQDGINTNSTTNNFIHGATALHTIIGNYQEYKGCCSSKSIRNSLKPKLISKQLNMNSESLEQGQYIPAWKIITRAATYGDEETISILLRMGYPINFTCDATGNALQYSTLNFREDATRLLLESGADPNSLLDYLYLVKKVIHNRQPNIIKLLIQFGAIIRQQESVPILGKCLDLGYLEMADIFCLSQLSESCCNRYLRSYYSHNISRHHNSDSFALKNWIQNKIRAPSCLQHITRKVIVTTLKTKPSTFTNIEQLSIPSTLKSFLHFHDL